MLKKLGIWFVVLIVKGCLRLRYRVSVRGLEHLQHLGKKGGVLFLPSHPAEIDPVILMSMLYGKFQPRCLVVEHFYYLTGVNFLMKLIGAIPIPDMMDRVSNKWKEKKIEKIFADISNQLQEGENFLIYPAGKLRVSSGEKIGGASFVHSLIGACPDVNVVMIRTTGLWGSRFSKAVCSSRPDFGKIVWHGIKAVFKNGIFFTPKRDVLVEIEPALEDFPWKAPRLEMNKYLERWYNTPDAEPVKLVSDLFWKESLPSFALKEKESLTEAPLTVPSEIEKEVVKKLAEISHQSPDKIERRSHLSLDLGLDSLDAADLYLFLENKYDLENLADSPVDTVGDLLRVIVGKKQHAVENQDESSQARWPEEKGRPAAEAPVGETIQESFLRGCDRMDGFAACADALNGVMSYRRFKLGVLILAKKIKQLDGKYVGVLLPSSSSAYLVILAILLAKKIPVMLNWTVGSRALDHCVKSCQLRHVLSSRRFLNNLKNADIEAVEGLLILLEEMKETISLGNKLSGFYNMLKDAEALLEDFELGDVRETDPAVILFTSGTETLPKGVPLSHHNILTNQQSGFSCVDFNLKDIFYAVLPPFHSFGFSVTGLFPLLSGMRVYYSPDPTDYRTMARQIARWQATVFCCAPTFIKGVFQVATQEQLESLRYIVSGAEKTPQELFDYVDKLGNGKELIEGYGITECAPIVAITRPGKPRKGVGKAIPGVDICILDFETSALLPIGKEGEICIKGPNVFYGYLNVQKSPFITIQGKKWYRSGDRGFIDHEGHLTISGRLKRFAKIGGEMVSLGGLEEEIYRLALDKKWPLPLKLEGPPLAVAVLEKESEKPTIVLFTTFDLSREEVNHALRENGHGGIVKIGEVRKIGQIPLTGTGKTHYRALDEML
jgi:long-chain-fatty-acid--[acyl-carrier-protein] ligase